MSEMSQRVARKKQGDSLEGGEPQGSQQSGQYNLDSRLPIIRVSPSPMPDENEERMMTAISGHKLSQSLNLSSPISYCLKMLLESSTWYSPIVALRWQTKPLYSVVRMRKSQTTTQSQEELIETSDKQGMKQVGSLYQLVPSVRPTDGTEFGLLHTPSGQEPGVTSERLVTKEGEPAKIGERAYDKTTGRLAQVGLTQQINMNHLLPTANAWDGRRGPRKEYNPQSKSQ